MSDEDRMMQDRNLKWSSASIINNEKRTIHKNGIGIKKIEFIKPKKAVEKMDGFDQLDHLIDRQLLEDQF